MVPLLYMILLVCSLPASISHMFLIGGPHDLENHLCGPRGHSLLPGTQLHLSPDVKHILSSSSFCLVSNTLNITLSSVSNVSAIITANNKMTYLLALVSIM